MKTWLEKHLCELNLTESMERPEGFWRLGYTADEWRAMDVFVSIARDLGLKVLRDEAGNAIARWETDSMDSSPAVAVGSHLDTVKGGGGYDGVAGVLCGLAAVKKTERRGIPTDSSYRSYLFCLGGILPIRCLDNWEQSDERIIEQEGVREHTR